MCSPDASPAELWDAIQAAASHSRDARASAALAARGPEGGIDLSRPAAPEMPPGAWASIMDRASSCRCVVVGCPG